MSKSKGRKLAEWLRNLDSNSKASSNTLADDSVTAAKLQSDAVTNPKIADGAIHTANLADANVTFAKLHTDVTITSSTGISGSNDNDTTVPTTGALIDYIGAQIQTKDNSDEITEGSTNLYFTNARVASYLSTNGYGTSSTIIASITDSAPTTLDTLNELAAALGDDANFSTTITNSIATKLPSSSYTAADVLTKIKTVDGAGSGLDADLLDGQEGSYYTSLANATGQFTTISATNASSRDKIRVYPSGNYAIGMQDNITYGHLSDWAMTFQMNDDTQSDRGFWWGDVGHGVNQGAMSLTTNGRATIATSLSIGQGESITGPNSTTLYVGGNAYINGATYGGFGAVSTGGTTNWNDSTNARSGGGYTLLTGNATNGPGGSTYYHPFSFEYSSKNGTGNMTQLAIPYNGFSIWHRYRYSSSWTGWVQEWNSANDGSGSGLDADLWDGNQFSSYLNQALLTTSNPTFNTINYNNSLYAYESSNYIGSDPRWNNSGNNANEGCHHMYATTGSGTQWGQTGLALYNGGAYVFLTTKSGDSNWYHNNNKMWSAGNDGSGSGLDADTLDGVQGSGYQTRLLQQTDRNIVLRTGSTGSAGLFVEGSNDTFRIQIYGTGTDYGFLASEWGAWDIKKTPGGNMMLNNSNSNIVWHAGNDGSGSGLDADTLDGVQGASFLRSDASDTGTNITLSSLSLGAFTLSANATYAPASIGHTASYAEGIFWHTTADYSISRTAGAWTGSGNYQQLNLNWPTGIYLNGGTAYGLSGVRVVGNNNSLIVNGNVAWNAGNDGSGSGLDADTVDGIQASGFMQLGTASTSTATQVFSAAAAQPMLWRDTNATNATNCNIYSYWYAQGSTLGYIGYGSSSNNYLYLSNGGHGGIYLNSTSSTNTVINGNVAWHAGNDGAGSGLDADTVDGIEASGLLQVAGNQNITGHKEFQNDVELRFGNSANVRMEYRATGDFYCRSYSHGARLLFQGENSSGSNKALVYMDPDDATSLYHAGVQKGYTYSSGWRVTGNVLATSDVYAYYSDERLKTKQGKIESAIDKVNSIETFYYTHNDLAKEHGFEEEKMHVGVSAQTVEKVMPEVVALAPFDNDGSGGSISGENYKTVQYEKLVPLLIEAIKEQQVQIEELKEIIKCQ